MIDKTQFHVYILFSPSIGKHYIGQTSDLPSRLINHNSGLSDWTSQSDDWILKFSIEVGSRSEAMRLERTIKKRGAKRWLLDQNA